MRLAYLTTVYPELSHSFIRREIEALESQGHAVLRLAIRGPERELPEPADRAELARTAHCLAEPWGALGLATLVIGLTRPLRWLAALRTTLAMSRVSARGLTRHLAYLVEAAWLTRRVEAAAVEHLHVHFGTNPTSVARLMRCLGGPPYSFTVHGPDELDAPEAHSLGDKMRAAEAVIAISSYGAAQLRRWLEPESWPKIEVIRCGVPAGWRREARPVDAAAQEIVCVARLAPQKGHLVLLEALELLAAQGREARLRIVGDGPERPALERRIAERLAGRARITGWLPEAQVRAAILEARVFVQPSFAEGLPVALMEAMALERPVVATWVAGIPELVSDGACGWLVPAGDAPALARALGAALDAPIERLRQMGQEGARRVAELHDQERQGARAAALFERLIRDRAPSGSRPRRAARP